MRRIRHATGWVLLAACFALSAYGEPVAFKADDVVFMIGDSHTQRALQPGGFLVLLQHHLDRRYPTLGVRICGSGSGWDTLPGVRARFDRDVTPHKPDYVIVLIGGSDVHKPEAGGKIAQQIYRLGLEDVVWRIRKLGAEPVLCTLMLLGEHVVRTNGYDELLEAYSQIIRDVCADKACMLIELRKPLREYLKQHNPDDLGTGVLTLDSVHLNAKGNEVVAAMMYEAFTGEKLPEQTP